jgi:hypothetical protein
VCIEKLQQVLHERGITGEISVADDWSAAPADLRLLRPARVGE